MQGILLKKKNGGGIILTRDGGFCQGEIGEGSSVGEEAAVDPPQQRKTPWFAAAVVIAVAVLSFSAYRMILPSTWAYVTLDMEPSVEISLDRDMVITGQRGFNAAGKELVAMGDLRGKHLESGISAVLKRALDSGYLEEGTESVLLVTGTADAADDRLSASALSRLVARSFPVQRGKAEIVAVYADAGTRKKAEKDGLSAGRYLLLREVQRRGLNVPINVVREGPLKKLEREGSQTVAALVGEKGFTLVRSEGEPLRVPGQEQEPPAFFAAPVPER
ncbi:MAG: hypothetical protein AB1500_02540 [Bacillota bacterium]